MRSSFNRSFQSIWYHCPMLPVVLLLLLLSACNRAPSAAQSAAVAQAAQPAILASPLEIKVVRDIVFARPAGSELKLDVYQPAGRPAGQLLPVVLYFHGGGWRSGDKQGGAPYLDFLARRGIVGVSANYRLSGAAQFPAQLEDARAALAWVAEHGAEYGADAERIGVLGTSAGGHLAALLGTAVVEDESSAMRVRAVADWYGPADLRNAGLWPQKSRGMLEQLLGGTPAYKRELAQQASPTAQASAGDPPFLIIHGDRDTIVPVQQSRALRDALQTAGVPVEYVEVAHGGHGDFGRAKTAELLDKTAAFFSSRL
jgi:acetyl esterase/lipase